MRKVLATGLAVVAIAVVSATLAAAEPNAASSDVNATAVQRQQPFVVRPFRPLIDGKWIGNAICYGPHRDGQRPGEADPSAEETREDMRLMAPHWQLFRLYGAGDVAERVLQSIRDEQLPMRVVLGAWIASEFRRDEKGAVVEPLPQNVQANRQQIESAIALANKYSDLVAAISVGNETQVSWSFHKVQPHVLISYIREARAKTEVPVTVADDFNFWKNTESKTVAKEVDFIMCHMYAMWNGQKLPVALKWTEQTYSDVTAMHPEQIVVIGETGWATKKHTEGEQGYLIQGKPGEAEQLQFYQALREWAADKQITTFYFEAFDENWKGGSHPDEVEKHWGVYQADRTPKLAVKSLQH